jgi:FkbM family methyltransferase
MNAHAQDWIHALRCIGLRRNFGTLREALAYPRDRAVRRRRHAELRRGARELERDGPLALWEVGGESWWVPAESDMLVPMVAEQRAGLYDHPRGMVRPGDVVLDGGACLGLFSRRAIRAGAALVVAFEPDPGNFACLSRNLANEVAAGRAVVDPRGLWNQETELSVLRSAANFAATRLRPDRSPGADGPRVLVSRIDRIVAELKLSTVDCVKLDVEGAEVQALEGARDTIRRFAPRLAVALEHRPDDPTAIPRAVLAIRGDYRVEPGYLISRWASLRPGVLFFFGPTA